MGHPAKTKSEKTPTLREGRSLRKIRSVQAGWGTRQDEAPGETQNTETKCEHKQKQRERTESGWLKLRGMSGALARKATARFFVGHNSASSE